MYQSISLAGIPHKRELDCIGIFILFERVTGWHGLFPSWEGRWVVPFPRFHEDKGREISVIFHELPPYPPLKSPPKRGLSKFNYFSPLSLKNFLYFMSSCSM